MSSILDITSYVWDVNGWRKLTSNHITISDWNQTLVSKINECSAQVFKANKQFGGADLIEISPNLIDIFESLEYYDSETNTLSGRYDVIINDNWVSAIKIYNQTHPLNYRTIGVIGLGEYKSDEIAKSNKSVDKIYDLMYLLIR